MRSNGGPGAIGDEGKPDAAVEFDAVSFAFDEHVILRDLTFAVAKGTMTIVLGQSGVGKSVTLKLILGLLRPDGGAIHVNGERVDTMSEPELNRVRGHIGMVFQELALFDSLTVAENVGYRLSEEMRLPEKKSARGSKTCSASSGSASSAIGCPPSFPAASGGESP